MLVNQSLGHNELRTFAGLGGKFTDCTTADGKAGTQMCYPKAGCSPCKPSTTSTQPIDLELPAWWAIASVAGTGIGAYHGWKRNKKVGWAIVWAVMGGLAPIIVIPLAFAQGFGKKRKK